MSHDLSWNKHINQVRSKANKSLGFVRRNLRINSPIIKVQAYKSLVRPQVEYCMTVWDPYTQKTNTNFPLVYDL